MNIAGSGKWLTNRFSRRFSKAAGLLLLFIAPAQAQDSARLALTAVRHWSFGDVTRIALEVSGEFRYKYDKLSNPPRVYFDLFGVRQRISKQKLHAIEVGDRLVEQIRVAETLPAVTRVVIDLQGEVDYSVSELANPHRLIIEIRPPQPQAEEKEETRSTPPSPEPAKEQAAAQPREPEPAVAAKEQPVTSAPAPESVKPPAAAPPPAKPNPKESTRRAAAKPPPATAPPPVAAATPPPAATAPPVKEEPKQTAAQAEQEPAPSQPEAVGKPAQRTRAGGHSLTRALGLKLNRVVIDPGHGGHDTGTIGRSGVVEKELVLDVAKRLGGLIEERMGAEVIYTRVDDTAVPLETRTRLANEARADLFISIHANSSRLRTASGAETFYLNFTSSRADLEVAARENAGSQMSIHELSELVRKITLKDKMEESREFAARVQRSLHSAARSSNPASRDRGVKMAPFVVLIGASMPSVLVELGFLSNPREESLMKREDQRRKYAEALFSGIASYAATLSHFQQVAQGTSP